MSVKSMLMFAIDASHAISPLVLEEIKKNLSQIFISRMISSKTVEIGLLTYGTEITNNYVNLTQGDYYNIHTVFPIKNFTIRDLDLINEIKPNPDKSIKSSLYEALAVASDLLIRLNEGKKYNRILSIITTFDQLSSIFNINSQGAMNLDSTELTEQENEDLNDFLSLINSLIEKNIIINFLVIEQDKFLSALVTEENLKSNEIKLENLSPKHPLRSANNFEIIQEISTKSTGKCDKITSSSSFNKFFTNLLGFTTRPIISICDFYITKSIKLSCQCFAPASKVTIPSLKKELKNISKDSSFVACNLKRFTNYLDEIDKTLVNPANTLAAYKYGQDYIPMDPSFIKSKPADFLTSKCFNFLGFIQKKFIKRHQLLDFPIFVSPQSQSVNSLSIFIGLWLQLKKANLLMLASYVSRENADPTYGVLIPYTSTSDGKNPLEIPSSPGDFIFYRLPFADDIREYHFKALDQYKNIDKNDDLKIKQKTIMKKFVKNLTLIPKSEEEIFQEQNQYPINDVKPEEKDDSVENIILPVSEIEIEDEDNENNENIYNYNFNELFFNNVEIEIEDDEEVDNKQQDISQPIISNQNNDSPISSIIEEVSQQDILNSLTEDDLKEKSISYNNLLPQYSSSYNLYSYIYSDSLLKLKQEKEGKTEVNKHDLFKNSYKDFISPELWRNMNKIDNKKINSIEQKIKSLFELELVKKKSRKRKYWTDIVEEEENKERKLMNLKKALEDEPNIPLSNAFKEVYNPEEVSIQKEISANSSNHIIFTSPPRLNVFCKEPYEDFSNYFLYINSISNDLSQKNFHYKFCIEIFEKVIQNYLFLDRISSSDIFKLIEMFKDNTLKIYKDCLKENTPGFLQLGNTIKEKFNEFFSKKLLNVNEDSIWYSLSIECKNRNLSIINE